jgi:hypothetical protein
MLRFSVRCGLLWGVFLGCCLACSEDVRLGENFGGGVALPPAAAGAGAGAEPDLVDLTDPAHLPAEPDAAAPALVSTGPCQPVSCGGMPRQCGNCLDDDGDGRIDASDPECLGPCDDSEGALFSGIDVRVNGSCRADCYFDLNSGSGDDGCNWSFRCDPLSLAEDDYSPTGLSMCEYSPSLATCQMDPSRATACESSCLPLTPNGCDCFGCCELPAGSGQFIWLGSQNLDQAHCELSTSADPARCRRCTPVQDCKNDCKECELCVGKPELPASCGGAPSCSDGVASCDPRDPGACGPLHYCITGCCVPMPR